MINRVFRRPSASVREEEFESLREELRLAREEAARLRLDRQKPPSTLATAFVLTEDVPATSPGPVAVPSADDVDAILHTHAETAVMVDSLLVACEALRTCVDQVQRQLETGRPAPELDRRNTERRSKHHSERRSGEHSRMHLDRAPLDDARQEAS